MRKGTPRHISEHTDLQIFKKVGTPAEKIIENKFDVSGFFPYFMYMNLTLDNLKIDQVDYIDSNVVNVFCLFDSGKGYYEGGLSADVVISEEDGFIFADAVKVNFVEDEDEKEIEFTCDAKELEKKIEYNLNNVMNSPMTNENERQLIDALS
jgi:hypothetical protein